MEKFISELSTAKKSVNSDAMGPGRTIFDYKIFNVTKTTSRYFLNLKLEAGTSTSEIIFIKSLNNLWKIEDP